MSVPRAPHPVAEVPDPANALVQRAHLGAGVVDVAREVLDERVLVLLRALLAGLEHGCRFHSSFLNLPRYYLSDAKNSPTTFQFLHRSEACRRNLQRAPASRHTILAKPSGHSPNSFLLACGICLCKISEPTRCLFGSGVGSLLRDHTMTQLASTACSRPWWWGGGGTLQSEMLPPSEILQITKQISGQISDFRFQMPDAVAIT